MGDETAPNSSWDLLGKLVLTVLAVVLGWAILHRVQDAPGPHGPIPMPRPGEKNQLVFVSSRTCVPCAKMERETFGDQKVKDRIAGFHFFKVSGKEAERYAPKGFPTYLVLDADGREVRRGSGYRGPDAFLAWLDQRADAGPDDLPERDDP
jgi:thioredoxin-related protein